VPLQMMSHQAKDPIPHLSQKMHQLSTQDAVEYFPPAVNCPSVMTTDVERTIKRAYKQVESC